MLPDRILDSQFMLRRHYMLVGKMLAQCRFLIICFFFLLSLSIFKLNALHGGATHLNGVTNALVLKYYLMQYTHPLSVDKLLIFGFISVYG